MSIPRTLVVAGHFPPRLGGIETFTWELLRGLPPEELTVVAPRHAGSREVDAALDFPVLRRRGPLLAGDARRIIRERGCRAAWIPAAAPFGLCAPMLRAAGIERIVASTHGQELGWLRLPPTRAMLRAVARSADVLTYLRPSARVPLSILVDRSEALQQLAGGVDTAVFRPPERRTLGTGELGRRGRQTVITASRLVRRKGHDVLLTAWPRVLRRMPDAQLVVIGDGPMRTRLERAAHRPELGGSVRFLGRVPTRELVARLGESDVFVAPSRDLLGGLVAEGLGLSVLEASATGLPVVVGRSGGSSETLVCGRTGLLVRANDPVALAAGITELLQDRPRARSMGLEGRRWVGANWGWTQQRTRLAAMLSGALA
jgi:phosphatidyl-myo-inositol dimannoside synthase